MSKPKYKRAFLVTPEGVSHYSYFLTPDTFKNKNTYECQHEISREFATAFKAEVDAEMERIAKELGVKSVSKVSLPYKVLESGALVIHPKLPSRGIGPKGPFEQAPKVWDAQHNQWNRSTPIPWDSRTRLQIEIVPHGNSKDDGQGFMARLYQVEVVKLKHIAGECAFGDAPRETFGQVPAGEDYDSSADFA